MAEKKLSKLLEELHTTLDNTEAVDEKGREFLRVLNADIQELLERSEDGGSDESLVGRLQETIDHFEATHPSFTSALSNLLIALSNAGI